MVDNVLAQVRVDVVQTKNSQPSQGSGLRTTGTRKCKSRKQSAVHIGRYSTIRTKYVNDFAAPVCRPLMNLFHGLLQNIVHHFFGDVHAGGCDAVAKLHRVINFVDGESVVGFEKIESEQSAADSTRRALT